MAVYARQAHLERERAQFQRDALHDPLTGLANRRAFDEVLEREIAQAHASGQLLSLVAFDLDHF
ncbi:diguanylate cyclase, partial [Escherichia coli]|nr:diguanylate cyclase [Escherichia coli]